MEAAGPPFPLHQAVISLLLCAPHTLARFNSDYMMGAQVWVGCRKPSHTLRYCAYEHNLACMRMKVYKSNGIQKQ